MMKMLYEEYAVVFGVLFQKLIKRKEKVRGTGLLINVSMDLSPGGICYR